MQPLSDRSLLFESCVPVCIYDLLSLWVYTLKSTWQGPGKSTTRLFLAACLYSSLFATRYIFIFCVLCIYSSCHSLWNSLVLCTPGKYNCRLYFMSLFMSAFKACIHQTVVMCTEGLLCWKAHRADAERERQWLIRVNEEGLQSHLKEVVYLYLDNSLLSCDASR